MHPEPPNDEVHVMSPRTLLSVFAALLVLTLLTVLAASLEAGAWEVWISMAIATAKAVLVAAYFMHLRFDKSFNAVILLTAIACLGLFLALTLADVQAYQ